jgi:hypothetical protein
VAEANLSSMGPLMKPLVMAAMKLSQKGGDKTKKKAEIKIKQKASVKVKHG